MKLISSANALVTLHIPAPALQHGVPHAKVQVLLVPTCRHALSLVNLMTPHTAPSHQDCMRL